MIVMFCSSPLLLGPNVVIIGTVPQNNLATLGLMCAIKKKKRYPDWFWALVDNLLVDLSSLVIRIERETHSLPFGTQVKIGAFYLHSLKIIHTLLLGSRDKPSGTFQIRIQDISPIISEP